MNDEADFDEADIDEAEHEELHDSVEGAVTSLMLNAFGGQMACVGDSLASLLCGYLSDPDTDRQHAAIMLENVRLAYLQGEKPQGLTN